MAFSSSSLSLLILSSFFLYLVGTTHAQVATPVAPGPTAGPLNLTAILSKGGQFTTLLRLLAETQVGEQIKSQLNNSFDGLTLFAPTDNAFNQLKAGTLNTLTSQEQVELVLYHVLPRFYSLTTFQTASNPLRTQASGSDGVYTFNVTSTTNQVNVSTGVNNTPVNSVLYSEFPLSVYSVDSVLLPTELFGPTPPTAAPSPSPLPKPNKKSPTASSSASVPSSSVDADSSTSDAHSVSSCLGLVLGFGFVGALNFLF